MMKGQSDVKYFFLISLNGISHLNDCTSQAKLSASPSSKETDAGHSLSFILLGEKNNYLTTIID
jgi:hypothetical protein